MLRLGLSLPRLNWIVSFLLSSLRFHLSSLTSDLFLLTPSMIISVSGGRHNFELSKQLETAFKRGLQRVLEINLFSFNISYHSFLFQIS
jgi:hypothetical protein